METGFIKEAAKVNPTDSENSQSTVRIDMLLCQPDVSVEAHARFVLIGQVVQFFRRWVVVLYWFHCQPAVIH